MGGARDGWQVREMFQVEERREGDDEQAEEGTRQTSVERRASSTVAGIRRKSYIHRQGPWAMAV